MITTTNAVWPRTASTGRQMLLWSHGLGETDLAARHMQQTTYAQSCVVEGLNVWLKQQDRRSGVPATDNNHHLTEIQTKLNCDLRQAITVAR